MIHVLTVGAKRIKSPVNWAESLNMTKGQGQNNSLNKEQDFNDLGGENTTENIENTLELLCLRNQ